MGLRYPPEWKFDPDGPNVPDSLRAEAYVQLKKIAMTADQSQQRQVVELFKRRFGNEYSSTTLDRAFSDLEDAMNNKELEPAEFADAIWLGIEDANKLGLRVPTVDQVNRLFAKCNFPFMIDPPHLRRTDDGPRYLGQRNLDRMLEEIGDPPPPSTIVPSPPGASLVPSAPTTRPVATLPTTRLTLPLNPKMPICFVAQPFREPFQGRIAETIEPAIRNAGMVAYKVEDDVAADKLIGYIHAAIERAALVLVDITMDNPNVWYELGYSQALKKPLVMISCTSERDTAKPYPFDVRGRKVIEYATTKRSDHEKLQHAVTKRLETLLRNVGHVPSPPPLMAPVVTSAIVPDPNDVDVVNLLQMAAKKLLPEVGEATIVFNEWDQSLGFAAGTTARKIRSALQAPYSVRNVGNTTALLVKSIGEARWGW